MVTGYSFPFSTNEHGIISHVRTLHIFNRVSTHSVVCQVAVDTANPSGWNVVSRVVVTTTTGAVQLWHQDQVQWTREESLASISVAEFVELPEKKVITSHVGEERESFIRRVRRQLSDAQVKSMECIPS